MSPPQTGKHLTDSYCLQSTATAVLYLFVGNCLQSVYLICHQKRLTNMYKYYIISLLCESVGFLTKGLFTPLFFTRKEAFHGKRFLKIQA